MATSSDRVSRGSAVAERPRQRGIPAPLWTPTSTNLFDAQNGPMANLGSDWSTSTRRMCRAAATRRSSRPSSPRSNSITGWSGIQVKSLGGDFNQFQTQLTNVGMQITARAPTTGWSTAGSPVNELPTIAELATDEGRAGRTTSRSRTRNYQGERVQRGRNLDVCRRRPHAVQRRRNGRHGRRAFDSVNQFGGGLADSYATGDLNPTNPVNVIQDGPAGSTDEGRAMLENIHDIAPGASLAFATGDVGGDLGFGQNIVALHAGRMPTSSSTTWATPTSRSSRTA